MKLSLSEAYPRHNTSVKHCMVAKGANKSSVAARIALGRVQHHKLFAWITIIAKSALDDAAKRIHRLLCGQRITTTTPTPPNLIKPPPKSIQGGFIWANPRLKQAPATAVDSRRSIHSLSGGRAQQKQKMSPCIFR